MTGVSNIQKRRLQLVYINEVYKAFISVLITSEFLIH